MLRKQQAVEQLQWGEVYNKTGLVLTGIVRSVLRDEGLTDRGKADRLIDLVDELGLTAPEARVKRFAIDSADVHLIAWMGVVPN